MRSGARARAGLARLLLLAVTLAASATAEEEGLPLPRPCPATGSLDYYRCRAADAVARRPEAPPPGYYLEYGDRYVRRFTLETRALLSPAGRGWLDRTRRGLQVALEAARRADPAGFATRERDDAALLDLAYATHPRVYLQAGLERLPLRDLLLIATTPDAQDLLTPRGLRQVLEVLQGLVRRCGAEGPSRCALERATRELREGRRLLRQRLSGAGGDALCAFLLRRAIGSLRRALEPRPGLTGALGAAGPSPR